MGSCKFLAASQQASLLSPGCSTTIANSIKGAGKHSPHLHLLEEEDSGYQLIKLKYRKVKLMPSVVSIGE
ncbi:hypothetical protein STEG23_011895, partial [Scotinomys teguina]